MAAHAHLKNEFTEDQKCHDLMRQLILWFLIFLHFLLVPDEGCSLWIVALLEILPVVSFSVNVLFLTSENEILGIIYSLFRVSKIFSYQYLVLNLS